MSDHLVAIIPHTLRDSAAEALAAELSDRIDAVEVRLPDSAAETIEGFDDADLVVTMGFDDTWYDHLETVGWVQALTAGVDHYDTDRLREQDVILTNASGVHAEPIAQQVLGYMLLFERNIHRGIRQQVRREWDRYHGGELGGKTLGIIGTGAIGSAVAAVCTPFDMRVIGTKRDTSVDVEHVDRLYAPEETETVLAQSDYVVLACPLTEDTRGFIDATAFETMSSDSILINIARGGVVDESAMITALEEEQIGGAGLDVFEEEPLPEDSPLWELSNVIITPHMAGSTPHYWQRCGELIAENVPAFTSQSHDSMINRIV